MSQRDAPGDDAGASAHTVLNDTERFTDTDCDIAIAETFFDIRLTAVQHRIFCAVADHQRVHVQWISTDPDDSTVRDDIIGLIVGTGLFFMLIIIEHYLFSLRAVVIVAHSAYFLYKREK